MTLYAKVEKYMEIAKSKLWPGASGGRKSLMHLNFQKSVPGLKRDRLGPEPSEIR